MLSYRNEKQDMKKIKNDISKILEVNNFGILFIYWTTMKEDMHKKPYEIRVEIAAPSLPIELIK